jgi:hypothetical protein
MDIPVSFRRFRKCIQLSARDNAINKPKLEATTLNLQVAIRVAGCWRCVDYECPVKLASIRWMAHRKRGPAYKRCDKLEGRSSRVSMLERMEK